MDSGRVDGGDTGPLDARVPDGGMDSAVTDAQTDAAVDAAPDALPATCGEVDVPDHEYVDANGDGIDGVLGCSVFVDNARGPSGADGLSPATALDTITDAIAVAQAFTPPRPVLVAAGTYDEVTVVSGVSIYGGYTSMTFAPDIVAQVTEIVGTGPVALSATALDAPTEVAGFVIRGGDLGCESAAPAGSTGPDVSRDATALGDGAGHPRDGASSWPELPVGADAGTVSRRPGFVDVTVEAGLDFSLGVVNACPDCLFDDITNPRQGGNFCHPERFLGAVAAADYDDDGWVDLYLTRMDGPDRLLRNRGDGTFEDVTSGSGLGYAGATGGAAWLDIDNDLDLYIAAVADTRHYLYINDGSGAFSERALERGAAVASSAQHIGMGIAVGDYDLDGYLDLFVAEWRPDKPFGNRADHNRLLHNRGATAERNGMGSTFGDIDGDGDLDWFVSAIWMDEFPEFGHRLYRNGGDRTFTDCSEEYGVRNAGWGWGSAFFDYDLDADLDLVMTAGWPLLGYPEDPLRFWENTGAGPWTDVAADHGVHAVGHGRGVVALDYDRDGDLDLLILNNARTPRLLRNDVAAPEDGAGWFTVAAPGTTSHSQGIGAVVTILASPGATPQVRHIGVGSHLFGQEPAVAHFGLGVGDAPLHRVTVEWPASPRVVHLSDVPRRQRLVIQEPVPEPGD